MQQDLPIEELQNIENESTTEIRSWAINYLDNKEIYYRNIVRYVEENLQSPILEIGSTPCHLTYIIKDLGYDITGLDLDPERSKNVIEAGGLDVRECDIEHEKFPVEDNSMSGVIMTEVLEHLRVDPLWTLREIHRVLRPGGNLLLTTPNLFSIYTLYNVMTTGKFNDPYEEYNKIRTLGHMGHVREYTAAEVKSMLEKNQFRGCFS